MKCSIMAALVVAALLSFVGCDSLTGECPSGPCGDTVAAKPDAANSGGDTKVVGNDSSSGPDADANANQSDNSGQTDAAMSAETDNNQPKACPPAARPEAAIEVMYQGQTLCLTSFEQTAFNILATHKGMPATKCADFGDSDYCIAEFLLAPSSTENGCFDVTITYPQAPDVKYAFTFQKCDEATGLCAHEKKSDDGTVTVVYDVPNKLFTKKILFSDGISGTEAFKLVPKS